MFIDRESRRSQTAKPHWENQLSPAAAALVGRKRKIRREGQQAHTVKVLPLATLSLPILSNISATKDATACKT